VRARVRRFARRILEMGATFPHLRALEKLREAETPKLRVWIEQHRAAERGCLSYIASTLIQTARLYRSLTTYLCLFVSRQCMRAMILCDEGGQSSCPGLRNLSKSELSCAPSDAKNSLLSSGNNITKKQ